jgi:RNA 2',3'-cyclic 3'-phosphodiesterase
MAMATVRRLFFALWPDQAWSARMIGAAAAQIAAADGAAAGRALAGADLHVTLCFLGAVAEPELAGLLQRAAGIEVAAFELEFVRLEWWRQSRVLAATVAHVPPEGEGLAAALAAAAREVGLTPDPRAWRPHMTLLRGAAAGAAAPAAANAPLPLPLRMPATRFYLAQSQGLGAQVCSNAAAPRYATLASWPLRS